MTWVYFFPEWLLFVTVLTAMSVLGGLGLVIYRAIVPQSDDVSHNDVAGPIIATVGTVLAVILSFMLVTVWQEYDQAAATVEQEASAAADLYHASASFPEPVRSRLRDAVRTYTAAILDQEWPAMRTGGASTVAGRAAYTLLNVVVRYEPKTNSQQALQQAAIGFANTVSDARRDRLFANQQGIPLILWTGMIILSAITVGCSYVFRIRNEVMHLCMSIALSAVIGVTFVLIAEFDYPFRGDAQIAPYAWQELQANMNQAYAGPPATESGSPLALARSRSSAARWPIRSASASLP